jgi:hypothetical protein
MTEDELHEVLETRAIGLEPAPVPSEGILAGARRRTVRRRTGLASVAVLATVGLTAGAVSATGTAGGGRRATPGVATTNPDPAMKPAKPAKPWVPRFSYQPGLAEGQTPIQNSLLYPAGVVISGTVDGVPWQLQAAHVVDPSVEERKRWDKAGVAFSPARPGYDHVYCFAQQMYVGEHLGSGIGIDGAIGGGGESGGVGGSASCEDWDPTDRDGQTLSDRMTSDVVIGSHRGLLFFSQVDPSVVRVVWKWDSGPSEEMEPVLTPVSSMPFVVFPYGEKGTITAYDAAGHIVAQVSTSPGT